MTRQARTIAIASTLLLGFYGCGSTTGETRITFDVEVLGKAPGTNDHGYEVSLTKAQIHLGPIHFFSGDPLFTRRCPKSWPARIAGALLGIRTAHAHPGHYQEGDAVAAVVEKGSFDLLATTAKHLGRAEGVTGEYRSAQVALFKPEGAHTVVIEGEAKKGSQKVYFSATMDSEEKIRGIAAIGAKLNAAPEGIRVEIDIGRWLERVDFSELSATAGRVTFPPDSQPEAALYRGVENTSAFVFSLKTKNSR